MAQARPLAPEDLEGVPTIELLNELKRRHHLLSRPRTRVAVLGPPCVGKRTQAEALRRAFGICRISSRDLLGQPNSGDGASSSGSSDERAMANLRTLLDRPQCRRGFVLEGFPFTASQAQRLQETLEERQTPLDAAVLLDAPEESLLERCRGRLLHAPSGRLYHDISKPPLDDGLDDFTGEALQRPEFSTEKFREELARYKADEALLRTFFAQKGLLREINGAGSAEEIASSCVEQLAKRPPREAKQE